ncbi:MAG: ATPase, T2SS/T4P/T4SS family [Hymenobacter sp.]
METTFSTTFIASPTKFQDALLELELLTPQQIEMLKVESINSGRPLEQIARDMGLLDSEEVVRAWSHVVRLPYVDLRDTAIKREILNTIPDGVAKNYRVVTYAPAGEHRFSVAIADPKNIQALEALEFVSKKAGWGMDLHLASDASLDAALRQYGNLSSEVTTVLKEAAADDADTDVKENVDNADQLEKIVSDAPIAKAVGAILKYAVKNSASDVHIEPTEKDIKVRYRMDGVLVNTLNLPIKAHHALVSRIKILSNLKIDENRIPQDGRFNGNFDGKEIDFRVSTFPTVGGEKVVMRLLDKSGGIKTLEEIGVTGRGFEMLVDGLAKPYGLTVVTGPTGAGKSTTLYASLARLNDVGVNIVTLEDPVEYHMDGINQSQINAQIGYTFGSGLRSILRQDPGHRAGRGNHATPETAEMAVHASLTGHIVLSSLHTNDASGALPRLADMGVEPFLIASSVNTIVAQRLVRRICHNCKQTYTLNESELKTMNGIVAAMPVEVKAQIKPLKEYSFLKGAGCDICNRSGYKGRQGIFEILPMTEPVKELLLKGAAASQIKAQAIAEGMVTMQQDGILKVLAGITTLEEVILRTRE